MGLKLIQSCKDSVSTNGQTTINFMQQKQMKDGPNKLLTTCVAKGKAKTKTFLDRTYTFSTYGQMDTTCPEKKSHLLV